MIDKHIFLFIFFYHFDFFYIFEILSCLCEYLREYKGQHPAQLALQSPPLVNMKRLSNLNLTPISKYPTGILFRHGWS